MEFVLQLLCGSYAFTSRCELHCINCVGINCSVDACVGLATMMTMTLCLIPVDRLCNVSGVYGKTHPDDRKDKHTAWCGSVLHQAEPKW